MCDLMMLLIAKNILLVMNKCMSMEHWWTDIKRRKQNTQRKTCPSDIFTITW